MHTKKNLISETKSLPLIKLVFLALILNIATIILIVLVKENMPPEIPLFYGKTEGSEQLAPLNYIYIPPVMSILILFINVGCSIFVKDKFIKNSLSVVSFICSLFTTIAVIKIINLVGSIL
ncbi:MAG: hypothetical protein NZM26_00850 [Patescibacteria group bacterium]|nr:hypothetical protein [Patescibacteria group bacterium]